jgi:hypothetical protein
VDYRIHSRDYLHRARKCLDSGTPESLFYAAFELRCGIEARMQQYLEAQDHISEKMKKGWQIAKLAKNIEKTFKSGDKIVEYAILDQETETIRYVLYYTPVNSKLKKLGEKLGDYLHAMRKYRPEDDPWWGRTRDFLEEEYTELQKANIGTLQGVPLLNTQTRQINMSVEPTDDKEKDSLMRLIGNPGTKIIFRVSYLNELPNELFKGA